MVTQASSPYYARTTFWSIAATMAEAGLRVVPYHTLVPSFGEWGFVAGLSGRGEPREVTFDVDGLRFMTPGIFRQMLTFPGDMSRPEEVVVNRLDRPLLSRLYREDWSRW